MKTILNPVLKICLTLGTMLSLAGNSHGQLINVNFTGGGDSPAQSTLSGPAGGLGTTWNSVAAVSTGALNDSTGAATTVTVGTNYSNVSLGQQTSGTLPVFRSFLDTFPRPNGNNVTISGLESEGFYNIWVLSFRDIATGSTTERNVGTWSTSNTTTSPSSQSVNSQAGSPNGTAFQAGYNYVLFENVQATAGGVISFAGLGNGAGFPQDVNSRRIHLNGLQIEKTTPPVAGIVDDAMSTVDASPATVFADGVLTSTVTVTLRDANGTGVPNKNVTLANTGGPQAASINPLTAVTTNLLGQAVFSVSSGTPGIETFTATDVTDTLTLTDTASVEFVEVGVLTNAAQSTVVATPSARLAEGSSTSTITVTLRDANGYPVSAKNVTLANSGGPQAATISPAGAVVSDINGQAEFLVSSSAIGVEEFTATDTTDSIVVTQIATVSFIDPNAPKLVNVNFHHSSGGEVESALDGPLGGAASTWNQFSTGSGTNLLDSTSEATTIGWSFGNSAQENDTTSWPNPQRRMQVGSFAQFGKGGDSTLTLSGLEPGGFYNIAIASTRLRSEGTEHSHGIFSTTNNTTSASSQLADGLTSINGDAWVLGTNYVRFDNVEANGSGVISFLADATDADELFPGSPAYRLHLNGFQIQKTDPPLASYATWSGGAPADGDANNDGVQNAVAWVLGAADPDENAVGLLPSLDNTSDPDFFIFNYRRSDNANSDANTAIKVEYSSDLVNWPDAVAGPDIVITPFIDDYAVGIDRVEVKIRRTLGAGGKLFARLNVEVTP